MARQLKGTFKEFLGTRCVGCTVDEIHAHDVIDDVSIEVPAADLCIPLQTRKKRA